MKKTHAAMLLVAVIYVVGFIAYPPPEKEDSNLLVRILWPLVAIVVWVEDVNARRAPK